MSDRRTRTAYHEAGHFVIGHLFNFPHVCVSIRGEHENGILGQVVGFEEPPWRAAWTQEANGRGLYDFRTQYAREVVEQWVCSLYAGFAAQVHFSPNTEPEARLGALFDDDQAEEWLERVRLATDADRNRLRERTAALVQEHWEAIERIALELLEREEIDAPEAQILYEIVRGEATEADLELYRALRASTADAEDPA